ncbi:type-B carboxylesterase lipase family [Rhizoctonia solani]|uniref:Carboxylic ester hydrolase n=1 Tax=Rhizoctonia solani TaxID=456999 RepID=A0A8H7IC86_9AGAM|nr:type-B carboxylesterase lipase family [Rhizoctonia solani]
MKLSVPGISTVTSFSDKYWDATGLTSAPGAGLIPFLVTMVFWQRASALLFTFDTASGKVQGFYNNTAHTVRAFLGVPFAAAPTGSLRFLPPQKRQRSSSTIQATSWPPSCPACYQRYDRILAVAVLPIAGYDEDCLSINVWTPSTSRSKKGQLFPVNIYIYGGSFDQGGTSIPTYEATDLVANHDVVSVHINYRVTIFGNPNSPYLAAKGGSTNVGLLDQRFAIEWLKKNVAAFGGDPKRMIVFGQSAGSISAGYLPFAYPNNPIITGIGELSASILIPNAAVIMPEIAQGNFTDLATTVGCASGTDKQIFECMQKVPWKTLIDNIVGHTEKNYLFRIVADGITAFNDIPTRIAAGKLAKIPQFSGQLDHEADSLVPFSFDGINQTAADEFTYNIIVCPAVREAQRTYVVRRSEHGSGLKEKTTAEQKKQSAYMQGALAAFTKDPKEGLAKYGWPLYQGNKGKTLVHLDPSNSSKLVVLENPAEFDTPCGST